ncbi:MAG: glycosyltransferase family 4 protein [Cytophagales bacterium]|nr:glycosyltransferase family 4 protein [Cytophagales bacterium]
MESEIKVLMIIHGRHWNDTQEQVYWLTKGLIEKGLNVHMAIARENTTLAEKLLQEEIPCHFYEKESSANFRINLNQHFRLAKIINKFSFDIVIAHSPQSLAHYIYAKPLIRRSPKLIFVKHAHIQTHWIAKVLKFQQAHKIVVVCDYQKELLAKSNFLPQKLTTIQSGLQTDRFRPDPDRRKRTREKYGIRDDQKVFLNLSHWNTEAKGQRHLIEAFSRVKDSNALLVMAGRDTQTKGCEIAKSLDVDQRVLCLGYQKRTMQLFDMADFYVHSPLIEGIAESVIQAMLMGKVCLATLAGGIGSYLKDEINGFAVPVGNYELFTDKMEEMIALSPERYKELSDRARETGETFSFRFTVNEYYEMILQLMGG